MTDIVSTHVNDPLARTFRTFLNEGWFNQSSGDVEAPTGHFALMTLAPDERPELLEAFKGEMERTPYPGAYVLRTDSDGNLTLTEYLSDGAAKRAFNELDGEYILWLTSGDPWRAEA